MARWRGGGVPQGWMYRDRRATTRDTGRGAATRGLAARRGFAAPRRPVRSPEPAGRRDATHLDRSTPVQLPSPPIEALLQADLSGRVPVPPEKRFLISVRCGGAEAGIRHGAAPRGETACDKKRVSTPVQNGRIRIAIQSCACVPEVRASHLMSMDTLPLFRQGRAPPGHPFRRRPATSRRVPPPRAQSRTRPVSGARRTRHHCPRALMSPASSRPCS